MYIAIIGSGHVGGALAKNWAKAGHKICFGVQDLENFKGRELLDIENIESHFIADAVRLSEVIVVAAPPQATTQIIKEMGDVNGKIIIDAMNSVRSRPEGYNNSLEAFIDLAKGAEVVKCFNTTGFENMANPSYKLDDPLPHEVRLDMFMAGDSTRGKEIAKQLALDCGFGECYDFGGNDKAALLEQLVLIWINLAMTQGLGRNIAFKIIKRETSQA